MTGAPEFGCPWCGHESDDRQTLRTHLMIEHRKSEVVDYVVDACAGDGARDRTEAVTH